MCCYHNCHTEYTRELLTQSSDSQQPSFVRESLFMRKFVYVLADLGMISAFSRQKKKKKKDSTCNLAVYNL